MNNSYENLEKRALELEEARQVLRETDVFFSEATNKTHEIRSSFDNADVTPLLDDVESAAGRNESGYNGGFELE